MTPTELHLRRVSHRGQWSNSCSIRCGCSSTRKSTRSCGVERLYLLSRGRRVAVGSFLGPDEKASFAKALNAALQAARRGPTYNPVT
jgi:Integral membrane protein